MAKTSLIENHDYMTVRSNFGDCRLNLTINRYGVKASASGPKATKAMLEYAAAALDKLWRAKKFENTGLLMKAIAELSQAATEPLAYIDSIVDKITK